MRKEISGIKDMLQNQMSDLAWKDMERISPTQVQLLQRHLQMGIHIDLAKQLTTQTSSTTDLETAWQHSLGSLANQIEIQQDNIINNGGIYALVGPTGEGKTTTIAN